MSALMTITPNFFIIKYPFHWSYLDISAQKPSLFGKKFQLNLIKNVKAFHQSITVASDLAENAKLITFGIVPDKAETGYGYIDANKNNTDTYYSIKSFTEKPTHKNATPVILNQNKQKLQIINGLQ